MSIFDDLTGSMGTGAAQLTDEIDKMVGGGRRRRKSRRKVRRKIRRRKCRTKKGRMYKSRRRGRRSARKGTRSRTHPNDYNYTTKRGDRDFHRRHHNQKRLIDPFMF